MARYKGYSFLLCAGLSLLTAPALGQSRVIFPDAGLDQATRSAETRADVAEEAGKSQSSSDPPQRETQAPVPQNSAQVGTPGSELPAAATAAGAQEQWLKDYTLARQHLIEQNFREAERQFQGLAKRTSDPQQRALCLELAGIAKSFSLRQLASGQQEERPNQRTTDELASLYLNAVLYGLGTGGWLAVQAEPDSAAGAILPALGLAGAAAGGIAWLDHAHAFGYGVPQTIVSGMYIGLEQGLAWTLWNQSHTTWDSEWSEKQVATLIWTSASAGAVAGGVLGSVKGTTPGRAAYVGSAALWGGLVTGLFAGAISSDEHGQRDDYALLAGALGVSAGAIGGALTAGSVSPGVGRVRFLDLGGIAGGLVAGGLYVSAVDRVGDPQIGPLLGITAAGAGVGLTAAWLLTRGMARDVEPAPERATLSLAVQPMLLPQRGGAIAGFVGQL